MGFRKNVSRELREFLSEELQRYTREIPMNAKERSELRKWVQSGHSPYDNGWYISTETGEPLDFINALRAVQSEAISSVSYDTETDHPVFMVEADMSADALTEELPF